MDLMTSIDGVTFSEAWLNRVPAELDGLPVHVLGKADLLRNKLACGRPNLRHRNHPWSGHAPDARH
jgi:hypothetical protein